LTSFNSPFVGYQSLASPQAEARFIAIFTFTTPAFSRDGKSAFLEVWTEDGQYARMGALVVVENASLSRRLDRRLEIHAYYVLTNST
jgi:hypothetical protein